VDESKTTYAAPLIVIFWLFACAFSADVRLGIGVVAIGGAVVSIALFPVLFRRLFAPSIRLVLIGLAAAAVMIVATYGLYPILVHAMPDLELSTRDLYVNKLRVPHVNFLELIVVCVIVVGEEILWRGVVQEAVESRLKAVWALPASAFVYAIAHAPIGSPLLVVVAVACGLFWSILRNRTSSLLPSLIAHLIWDIAIVSHPLASL
jgi:membrane protease YdiL (CAAX protease family)